MSAPTSTAASGGASATTIASSAAVESNDAAATAVGGTDSSAINGGGGSGGGGHGSSGGEPNVQTLATNLNGLAASQAAVLHAVLPDSVVTEALNNVQVSEERQKNWQQSLRQRRRSASRAFEMQSKESSARP